MEGSEEWRAPSGQIWVCPLCGRTGYRRDNMGDTSCFLKAALCYEEKNENGDWVVVEKGP